MTELIKGSPLLLALILALGTLAVFFYVLKKPERGLYMTFFFTGFLLSPNLPIVREKLTGVEFLMTLTWFALLVAPKKKLRPAPLTRVQTNTMILGLWFVCWIFISFTVNLLIFPVNLIPSLVETVNFIYGYCMFATVVLMVRDWNTWWNCVKGWLWGSVMVSVVGVLALFHHAPQWAYDQVTGRVCSTLRTENQVPSFLLPILPVLVFLTVEKGRRIRDRWALAALLTGVFLTAVSSGSRTAFLMMICATLGVLVIAFRERRSGAFNVQRFAKIALFVFVGFFIYIFLALANYRGDYQLGVTPTWQRPVVMLYDWAQGKRDLDDTRERQLQVVSDNIGDNLVVGTGPKNYGVEYDVMEIHNTYAGVLLQLGVPGLLLFLLWLGLVLFVGWRAGRRIRDPRRRLAVLCMEMGMLLLMLYGLTMFGLRQRNIWLLAGLLVAAEVLVPRKRLFLSNESSAGPLALPRTGKP